jgi:hypothetical protein
MLKFYIVKTKHKYIMFSEKRRPKQPSSAETPHRRRSRMAMIGAAAAVVLMGSVAGEKLISGGKAEYKGASVMPYEGAKIPVKQIAEQMARHKHIRLIASRPMPALGGTKAEQGENFDQVAAQLEDQDIATVEQLKKTYNAKFETALQMKNGLRINFYGSGKGGMKVNPEGFGAMLDGAIETIPYLPDNEYKKNALSFYDRATQGHLSNIQINVIQSTMSETIVGSDGKGFNPIADNVPYTGGRIDSFIGELHGNQSIVDGTTRQNYNFTIVAGRAKDTSYTNRVILHEFGHVIAGVTSTNVQNAHDDTDWYAGRVAGRDTTNTEHVQFVQPIELVAGYVNEQAVRSGLAQPAYEFTN